jgi:hypothetical protein
MGKNHDFSKGRKAPDDTTAPAPQKAKSGRTPKGRAGGPIGRPVKGKRSDEEFEPTTLYMRKKTKQAVRMRLLEEGSKKKLSDVVEELVAEWVERGANL